MDVVDKGQTYEVYLGAGCALRMDWSGDGIRYTYKGYVESSCGGLVVKRLDAMVRSTPSITVLHDFWEASGLDSQVRADLVGWSNRHPHALASVQVLAQSKVVAMSMSVWALTDPGLKIYSKRPEFDVLCRKLGLPLNIRMPALTRN